MSALPKLSLGIAAAAVSCLMAGQVVAQQQAVGDRQNAAIDQPAATNPEIGNAQSQPGRQIDRPAATSPREYTANFRGANHAGGNQADVQRYIVGCLLTKNQGEVEMGQFAQQQSQNQQVKEFAQQMVQDHGKLVQQLQQLSGKQTTAAENNDRDSASPSREAAGQTNTVGDAAIANHRSDNTIRAGEGGAGGNSAVDQLMAIERQISQQCLQNAKEELQQKKGVEFDKCYIGSQIDGHMQMLAALEVLQQQGPDQVKQIAQKAKPDVQKHLDHAKQIMQQLEGASGSTTNERAARQPAAQQR